MLWVSCSFTVSQGHWYIWRVRRPSHKPQSSSSLDADPGGEASARPAFALHGPDGSAGRNEANVCQESAGLCAWAGMTKAMGQKELWLEDTEVMQSRSCPRDGTEGVFLTRKHKSYHEHEP